MNHLTQTSHNRPQKTPLLPLFSQQDADCLAVHRELLLSLEERLVQGFYQGFGAYSDKPLREQVLRTWWQKTLGTPLDSEFWHWQMLVNQIHHHHPFDSRWYNHWEWQFFNRFRPNQPDIPSLLSMWDWLLSILNSELAGKLKPTEKTAIEQAFARLGNTVKIIRAEMLKNANQVH